MHGRRGCMLVEPLYCYNIKTEVVAILRETMTTRNILLTTLQRNVQNKTAFSLNEVSESN